MIRRFLRGLVRFGALVVVLVVLFGPVVVMAAIAGNPIDGDLVSNLGQRADDDTIIKLLSLAFYVVWAWFAIPALRQARISLARAPVTGHASPADQAGPRGWLARLTRYALSSAAVATVTVATLPTSALLTAATEPVSAAGDAIGELVTDAQTALRDAGAADADREQLLSGASVVVATDRDTPTSIALTHFAERDFETVRDQIVELNRGRPTPTGRMYESGAFGAGMEVLVPAATTSPTSTLASNSGDLAELDHDRPVGDGLAELTIVADLDDDPTATTIEVVEPGDHLWGLSEEKLDAADGDDSSPTNQQVATYLSEVIDANPDIADPDLIYPDQTVTMPAIDPDIGIETGVDTHAVGEDPVHAAVGETGPVGEDATSAEATVTDLEIPSAPMVPTEPPGPPTLDADRAAAVGPPEVDPVDDVEPAGDESGGDEEGGAGVALIGGLMGAPVLASALFLTWRRLRRRRRAASATTVATEPLAPVEEGLVTAAQVGRVQWAGQQLANLVLGLRDRSAGAPLLVEVSDLGVEVVWDGHRDDLVMPWESTAGGRAWRLAFDPDDQIPEDLQAAAFPGLVTIGDRGNGGHTLVDLEAYGSLAVTGDPVAVESVLRSMVLEMGAGDEIGGAIVRITSSAIDGIEHLDWVSVREPDTVKRELAAAVAHADQQLAETQTGDAGVFGLRVGQAPHTDMIVAVVPNPAEVDTTALIAATRKRSRVAVVVAGEHPDAVARLEVAADGTAVLWPAGIELTSVASVSRQVASEIAASFDHVASLEDITIRDDEVWPTAVQTARQEYAVIDAPLSGVATEPDGVVLLKDSAPVEPVAIGNVEDPAPGTSAEPTAAPPDETTIEAVDGGVVVGPDAVVDADEPGGRKELPFIGSDGEIDLVAAGDLLGGSDDEWEVPTPNLMVSVLGPLRFGEFADLRPRDVSLIAFMALNGHQATHDDLRNAIWRGRAVSAKTIQNTISKIRGATQDTLIISAGDSSYVLDEHVRTDLDVFTEIVANADGCSSAREMDLLQTALGMVRSIPFTDEIACEWSVESQHFSKACQMIEAAALRLVELANEAGDHHASRSALQVGCAALRGNEPLYRALIDLNYRRGDQAAMTAAWNELEGILEALGSGPSQETVELYESLKSATGPR